MSYREDLKKLQQIITSDGSSDEQRDIAREAKKKLIRASIDALFKKLDERSEQFKTLADSLSEVIEHIHTNQLTTAIKDINGVIGDIISAAKGDMDDKD